VTFLIDTNVISELARPRPDPGVVAWFERTPSAALATSVLVVGELRKGVERLRNSERKDALRLWLDHDLPRWFQGRIWPIDTAVADRWGRLSAATRVERPVVDALLAATALVHDARLVTRNEADFRPFGVELVNPWSR